MGTPLSSETPLPHRLHHRAISQPDSNPASSDLPATISLLQDLTALAESTLKSVSDFLSLTPTLTPASLTLARCPFDSRHLMPAESLFRHSLTCSSAPGSPISDLGFLDSLRYPKSLKPEDKLLKANLFVRPLPETEADICFSLDDELGEIDTNFFYRGCPGVVTTPEPDITSRSFTLPAILSTECANFINDCDLLGGGDLEQKPGILPSDFWAFRIEVESWSIIPASYSFTALLVAVDLHKADDLGMKRWVILNSPRFGILIDAAMRDHIFLLLKLCLKAVRREAICSFKLALEKEGFMDSRVVRYECPQLASSLTWLAFQISVLYSEMNGRLFVLGMLRESFLLVGRHLMLFVREKVNAPSDSKVISSDFECSGRECKMELAKSVENMEVKTHSLSESSICHKVFVSQVASAIAALHERFLLEQRVTALRFSQAMPRFQLINEYISTTIRASQERAKRPNYRPLLEHDGLLWRRQNMHEFGKYKTREELLAEERDYKRRRMSYRGKKMKRNPMQVLHDIIEEHTEEIKQAGGIGCNVKITSESTLDSKFKHERIKDFELQYSGNTAYETTIKKSVHHSGTLAVNTRECDSSNDGSSISCSKSHLRTRHEHYEDQYKLDKSKKDTTSFRSRSPSYHSDYFCSSERYSQQKNQNNLTPSRDKYDRRGSGHSSSYKDYDSRSTLSSKSREARKYEYNCTPESSSYSNKASEKHWVDSTVKDLFEDRYDPSRSIDNCDTFYEGHSDISHSLGSPKPHRIRNDIKHHDGRPRIYRHDSGQNKDYYKK